MSKQVKSDGACLSDSTLTLDFITQKQQQRNSPTCSFIIAARVTNYWHWKTMHHNLNFVDIAQILDSHSLLNAYISIFFFPFRASHRQCHVFLATLMVRSVIEMYSYNFSLCRTQPLTLATMLFFCSSRFVVNSPCAFRSIVRSFIHSYRWW